MTRTLALTPAQTLALTLTAAVALAVALPLGYRYDAAVVVDGPNDGGIDIRLWRRGVLSLVQCKCKGRRYKVSAEEVRRFAANPNPNLNPNPNPNPNLMSLTLP